MRLKALLAKQAWNLARVREIEAAAGKQPFTDAQRNEIKQLREESEQLTEDIIEARRVLAQEKALADGAPKGASQAAGERDRDEIERINGGPYTRTSGEPYARTSASWSPTSGRRTHAQLFGRSSSDMGGWRDSAELFTTLSNGMNDARLRPIAGHGGGASDPAGGFAIPSALEVRIVDRILSGPSIFMARANVQPMSTREQLVTTFDRSVDDEPGKMFGFKLDLHVEDDPSDDAEQTTTLRQIKMLATTRGILFDASNELLADAPAFETALMEAVTLAAANGIDYACLAGVGSGEPLGVLNAGATIEVAKESGQSAATIVYSNLAKMFARMPAGAVNSSIWLANPSTIPQLLTLSQAVGTGGSHIPVLTSTGGNFEILTRPVVFTDLLPPLGNAGDVMLVDPSQYTIGLRQGIGIASSAHVGFKRNRTAFRLLIRFDGQTGWDKPYQPATGGPTQSPFIKLGARA